jgi:hypothetical protein
MSRRPCRRSWLGLLVLSASLPARAEPQESLEGPWRAFWLGPDDTILTESARTVDFNGQALVPRFTYFQATRVYDGGDRDHDPLEQELRVFVTTVETVIGLTEDVTAAAVIPHVVKRLELTEGGERLKLDSEGIGDARLIAKWRFYKKPELAETTEAAALLGLELPTGRTDVRDAGRRLPAPLQPGSGSLDGIVGAAFTRVWRGGRWLVNADVIYKANSEAEGYRFGNALQLDAGLQYRVVPHRYERHDQLTLNAVLELNALHSGRDTQSGDRVSGTGGAKAFVSPGLQAILSEGFLAEGIVQVPIYRDLHGPQLSEDVRITVGIRWRF